VDTFRTDFENRAIQVGNIPFNANGYVQANVQEFLIRDPLDGGESTVAFNHPARMMLEQVILCVNDPAIEDNGLLHAIEQRINNLHLAF